MNVLLTNTGRRTYFIDFCLDLKKEYKKLNVHVCDNNIYSPTLNFKNIKKHVTPKVREGEEKYISAIISIVKRNKINLIIPFTNYDIIILSKKKRFFKNLNCDVAVSDYRISEIFLDKNKTFAFCKKHNIPTPEIINKGLVKKYNKKKKVVEKNIKGNASEDLRILEKNSKFKLKKKFIYQKYIKGSELHFDILNDFEGNYISSCIKRKISMRSGETDIAQTLNQNVFYKLAKNISRKTGHIGNLDCDAIIDKNRKVFFLDFNPRFGGGYPFTHMSGLNYLKFYH